MSPSHVQYGTCTIWLYMYMVHAKYGTCMFNMIFVQCSTYIIKKIIMSSLFLCLPNNPCLLLLLLLPTRR